MTAAKELNERFRRAGPLGASEFSEFAKRLERTRLSDSESDRLAEERALRRLAFLLWMGLVDFIPAGFRLQLSSYTFEEKIQCLKEALGKHPAAAKLARILIEALGQDLPPEWQEGLKRLPWKEALDLAWIFAALEKFIPFLPPAPRYAIRGLMKRAITPDLAALGHSLLDLCSRLAAGDQSLVPEIAALARTPALAERQDRKTISFNPLQRIRQTAMLPELNFA
ncbi:MAG: hypothetical protein ACM3YO_04140 [Bacteroidota bacterium]